MNKTILISSLILLSSCSSNSLSHRGRNPQSVNIPCLQSLDHIISYNPFQNYNDIQKVLDDYSVEGITLELGPSKYPICENCIPIDRYRNGVEYQYDTYLHNTKDTNKLTYEEWLSVNPKAVEFLKQEGDAWAVNHGGILADAQNLPFDNDAVSFVVMNHFPWQSITHKPADDLIWQENIFKEMKRVINKKSGVVFLPNNIALKDAVFKAAEKYNFNIYPIFNDEGKEIAIAMTQY